MFNLFIPRYMDFDGIDLNSAEPPRRLSWGFRRKCERYLKEIEKSRKRGGKPIDYIRVAMLAPWRNAPQLAIDLLNPGGEVFFDAGTYTIQDTSLTAVDNIKLSGSGYASLIKMAKSDATSRNLFDLSNKNYCEISHLRLWGDSGTIYSAGYATEFDHGVNIDDCHDVFVHHCWLIDLPGDGIYVRDVCYNINIESNFIDITNRDTATSIGRNCIAVVEGYDISIKNNVLKAGFPAQIDLETNPGLDKNIENVIIEGNKLLDANKYGISLNPSQDTAGKTAVVNMIDVVNNRIKNSDDAAILLLASATAGTSICKNVNIANNLFDNCGATMANRQGDVHVAKGNDVNITNNIFDSSGKSAIYLQQSGASNIFISGNRCHDTGHTAVWIGGVSGDYSKDVDILNNVIRNSGQLGGGTYSGIHCQYTNRLKISGNKVYDDQGSATQDYGIKLDNCTNFDIGEFSGYGNGTAQIKFDTYTGMRFINAPVASSTFAWDNLAANQTWVPMRCDAENTKLPMLTDGYIIGLEVFSNANVSAGVITVEIEIDGVGASGHKVELDTSNPGSNYAIFGNIPKTFNAGDKIYLVIMSDAALLPNGSLDIRARFFYV